MINTGRFRTNLTNILLLAVLCGQVTGNQKESRVIYQERSSYISSFLFHYDKIETFAIGCRMPRFEMYNDTCQRLMVKWGQSRDDNFIKFIDGEFGGTTVEIDNPGTSLKHDLVI